MDSGDGCTTMEVYLMSLHSTLKNGLDGKFYIMYTLP